MSLRPLRTFRIVAQKAHQRAAEWIRLLLLQPMTGAIKQSVFLHSRASARSHHIDGARSHVHCPVTFSTKESRRPGPSAREDDAAPVPLSAGIEVQRQRRSE